MSELAGLDLLGRAAVLGIDCHEYLRIAQGDPRIVAAAAVATPHAVRRLRAWIAIGRPDIAADTIMFHGDDSVRAIVISTLAGIPASVRWHAMRYVSWFEIGRGWPAAYMTTFGGRASDDDSPHVIVLDGRLSDDVLPSIICHELGHAIHRPFRTPAAERTPAPTLTELEADARLLAAFEDDRDAAARLLFRGEHLANEAARLWGHPCNGAQCPDEYRLRLFRERMDAAAELASGIGRQIDADLAAERAAATLALEGTP